MGFHLTLCFLALGDDLGQDRKQSTHTASSLSSQREAEQVPIYATFRPPLTRGMLAAADES